MLSKKAEGVLTGILWMAVVAIVSGSIAYAMWGSAGIGGAATTSKAQVGPAAGSAMATAKTKALAITVTLIQ